jgi:purine-binding chemotaxis protein CheW
MGLLVIPSGVSFEPPALEYLLDSLQGRPIMTATTAIPVAPARIAASENASAQYLTFSCAGEEYGVDILRVQEIRGWSPVTRLPEAPQDVMGVLNLRGAMVSIVSLRSRFGLEPQPIDAATVVIVLRVQNEIGSQTVGICVDGVSDVQNVARNAIMARPDVDGSSENHSVSGLVTLDGRTVILLNIDCLFGRARGF